MSKVLSNCAESYDKWEFWGTGLHLLSFLAIENGGKFHEDEIAKLLPKNMHGTRTAKIQLSGYENCSLKNICWTRHLFKSWFVEELANEDENLTLIKVNVLVCF